MRDLERAFAAIRAGDAASRERVILAHIPLVRTLAWRHPRGAESFEDVVQVGLVGLIKAVDRYRSDVSGTFVAFAAPTVLGEIRRHFRDHTSIVRLPRAVSEARPRVHMAVDDLRAAHARNPDVDEIAAEAGLPPALVREVLVSSPNSMVPFVDEAVGGESSSGAQVAVEELGYRAAEARADIGVALGLLDAREQTILRLRYEDDLTQSEIAARVGLSQMHVSRLLRRSLNVLTEATAGTRPPREAVLQAVGAS